jgi:O-antigen/teichoic acid export membrane protein
VLTSALLGDAFISWVTGRATEVPQLTLLLAALPVAALCPAIVLTAAAIATGRHRLLLLSWTLGLIALTGTLFLAPDGDINKVLIGVLVAGACPGIVLSIGFLQGVRRSQARGAVS